ncbi:cyclodeaminase/cyclohydrolase family protein [Clostridium chauvoei]|uniref:Cyclodeaminase/cyclohydrolase family protein n=2 Tax=Clostridium chauvoei TaxID=46867 RepID=A0ABD4RDV0_9CLOT|nr:cyclodeaminase/cyclohydrolase family protein [Clostridium chauvoei]ATD55234.1 formiminotransferase-cyclodeaminase [Clostridium chauvoei]ATD57094.1 formiminotransferase-cyclodeaminase [Clostridium chauvoei]MBX7279579.1 cyclodeaminase/cyclohydrolase family protein [Clostridium chauvoei]MBX7281948.1 cyclodeaminase/cyclohydrolase family protein [Clostridium chauvoei]MBX7284463.1 cyclodeaminase/cyclohydrolase family protein [Clostridium chauvoei]
MLFKEYSVNQFIEELSSDAPSPGGGSTAALVAALASSLNSMVYSLTVDKRAFEKLKDEEKKQMLDFQKKAYDFTKFSQEFMEKDRQYFIELMASFKLAKDTEEEKIQRSKAIKENTLKAMEVPLNLAREALRFYKNIEFAVEFGNKNLISDAGVAAILLNASIESAIINVKINLNSLRGESFSKTIESECDEILLKSLNKKDIIAKKVNKIIYPN